MTTKAHETAKKLAGTMTSKAIALKIIGEGSSAGLTLNELIAEIEILLTAHKNECSKKSAAIGKAMRLKTDELLEMDDEQAILALRK